MRSDRIFTNMTCSQSCTYCTHRSPSETPAFVALSAVKGRIVKALGDGARPADGGLARSPQAPSRDVPQSPPREIVFTGGEPTLRRDIAALIQFAKLQGAEHTVLETNATHITEALAQSLKTAGLSVARVNLSAPDERLDAITRDPGGFARATEGIKNLRIAGVPIDFSCAVVRSTRHMLADLPKTLAQWKPPPPEKMTLWVNVPIESPDSNEVLPLEEVVVILAQVERTARALGISVKLAPGNAVPPCAFRDRDRPAHLFSLTPGGKNRPHFIEIPACAQCHVKDRCPGIPEATIHRFGIPNVTPIKDDRGRRRLSLISTVEEQIARELVTPNRYRDSEERELDEDIIRVNFHCNQACRFCFVSTHLPEAGDIAIRNAIKNAAQRDVKITLSGGEPTLNPRIVEYVRLAKSLSARPVLLQTNAIRLDDATLANALSAAGLDEAFISLHGTTAEISDVVTSAPGTFVRSVKGIDNLYATGTVRIVLNFVICKTNAENLPEYVRFVAARWPNTFLNVSFVAPSTDVVPREEEFIPRYSDVLPFIEEGLAEGRRLGIEMGGFESMCGIPLCLVPASLDGYFRLTEIPAGFDRGEFIKTETCGACALQSSCYGLRRGYAELHGAAELRAIQSRENSLPHKS